MACTVAGLCFRYIKATCMTRKGFNHLVGLLPWTYYFLLFAQAQINSLDFSYNSAFSV